MGTTTEKLTYLQGTKDAIKNAIVAKGVEVPEGTTFRGYAEKVGEISNGLQIETCEISYSGVTSGLTGMLSFAMYNKDEKIIYAEAIYNKNNHNFSNVVVGSTGIAEIYLGGASDYELIGSGGVVVSEKNKITVNGSGNLVLKAIGGGPPM